MNRRMQINIIFVIVTMLNFGKYSYAFDTKEVNVVIRKSHDGRAKTHEKNWYEVHGNLNKAPVYLILEKVGKQQIAGYLFDGKGNKKYIYGEWFKNVLQVYDQSNTRLTILLSD